MFKSARSSLSKGLALSLSKGFTLIELLIVIAVIGILAVAVLSAINPIEQINKGTDTGKRSDAAELLNAFERFYATFQCYPWDYDGSACIASPNVVSKVKASIMKSGAAGSTANTLTVLSTTTNEIKPEFLNRTSLASLYVTKDSIGTAHVCFVPVSKTFQASAKSKGLGQDGAALANCTATTCNLCVPE